MFQHNALSSYALTCALLSYVRSCLLFSDLLFIFEPGDIVLHGRVVLYVICCVLVDLLIHVLFRLLFRVYGFVVLRHLARALLSNE